MAQLLQKSHCTTKLPCKKYGGCTLVFWLIRFIFDLLIYRVCLRLFLYIPTALHDISVFAFEPIFHKPLKG